MLIFLSNQFVRFLSRAAAGKMSSALVFKIIAFQIPYLLGLLLPVGLFLGILLAYGRLYVDSEMTVLRACGFSRQQLLAITVKCSLFIAILVAILTLYVSPQLITYVNNLRSVPQAQTLVQTLVPGRFIVSPDGRLVYYVESISNNRKQVNNIFIAQQAKTNKKKSSAWRVTSAEKGYQAINTVTEEKFIVTENGYQYSGTPGEKDFSIVKFSRYGVRLPEEPEEVRKQWSGMSNQELWNEREDLQALAELEWRIAIPLSVPVLAFLAVPLSQVPPRRGRFAQLLPAIILYTIFANMMFVSRDWIEDGTISPYIGLWWLHISLLLLALFLMMNKQKWKFYLFKLNFKQESR